MLGEQTVFIAFLLFGKLGVRARAGRDWPVKPTNYEMGEVRRTRNFGAPAAVSSPTVNRETHEMVPAKRDARIAGWLYFLFAAPGPFCLLYVPNKILVRGDAAETAANVLAHEMLLRTSVVIWLLGMALWIVMALALYRLFNGVSKALSSLLVIFVAVSAGIGFLNELNNLAAIVVLRGHEFVGTLTQPQREAAAMLFLRLHGQGNAVNEML